MNKLLIVFLGLFAAAQAVSFFELVKEEWNAYKVTYKILFYMIQYVISQWLNAAKNAGELIDKHVLRSRRK